LDGEPAGYRPNSGFYDDPHDDMVTVSVSYRYRHSNRRRHMKQHITMTIVLLAVACFADAAPPKARKRPANPAMAPVKDVHGLPRVLLIGDSISIGYTVPVRGLMKAKANVHRPRTNCGPTTKGLAEIDAWLGDGKWDVIHFNWGLHDLKYMGPQGQNLAEP